MISRDIFKMQIHIKNCTFQKNYGTNIANGAAISIDGMENSTILKYKTTVLL